jgi:hypothetical protein
MLIVLMACSRSSVTHFSDGTITLTFAPQGDEIPGLSAEIVTAAGGEIISGGGSEDCPDFLSVRSWYQNESIFDDFPYSGGPPTERLLIGMTTSNESTWCAHLELSIGLDPRSGELGYADVLLRYEADGQWGQLQTSVSPDEPTDEGFDPEDIHEAFREGVWELSEDRSEGNLSTAMGTEPYIDVLQVSGVMRLRWSFAHQEGDEDTGH